MRWGAYSFRGSAAGPRAWFSSLVAVATGVAILFGVTADAAAFRTAAAGLLLVWMTLNLPLLQRAEQVFLAMAVLLTGAAFLTPAPSNVLGGALERAALYLVFPFALNFLRDAARRSTAVAASGRYLIAQSPRRRYAALTVGGHLISVGLSLGALSLLGALIARSNTLHAAGRDPALQADRERRMTLALFRGFTAIVLWSPLGVGVAITLSMLPNLSWSDLAPRTVVLAGIFLVAGWLLDGLPALEGEENGQSADAPSILALMPMLAVVASLVGAVLAVHEALDVDLFVAVIGVVPLAAMAWIAFQYRRFGTSGTTVATLRRVVRHLRHQVPAVRADGVIAATAGYYSVIISALARTVDLGDTIVDLGIPPSVLALLLPAAIMAAAQLGLNPLVSAVVLFSVFAPLDPAPLPPLALALAVQGGWSLALSSTPYSGAGLVMARAIGKPPQVLARWNVTYGLICYAALVAYYAVALW